MPLFLYGNFIEELFLYTLFLDFLKLLLMDNRQVLGSIPVRMVQEPPAIDLTGEGSIFASLGLTPDPEKLW